VSPNGLFRNRALVRWVVVGAFAALALVLGYIPHGHLHRYYYMIVDGHSPVVINARLAEENVQR
jgi:hypothetical protein